MGTSPSKASSPLRWKSSSAADAFGISPIVRVPWNEPGIIGRVLDAGALGVLVPMIQTADDAKRVVEACLYPPSGRRSFGPIRVGARDGMGYALKANERVAVIPMIEALEAVEEIAAVPGVDALFVGPFEFRVDRKPNAHLGFGTGIHACLAQVLARAEMKILFEELIPRIRSIELVGDPSWVEAIWICSLKRLPIRYELGPKD